MEISYTSFVCCLIQLFLVRCGLHGQYVVYFSFTIEMQSLYIDCIIMQLIGTWFITIDQAMQVSYIAIRAVSEYMKFCITHMVV